MVDDAEDSEGMESVSEEEGVTRRGELRSADRGMESIVLNMFLRSW